MAYSLLGTRYTHYIGSGTSSPSGPDIRGWGKTYYDQTAEDLANNRSRIKVEYGDIVNVGISTSYTITTRIQKLVNGTWTNVDTKTYTKSYGSISSGTHSRGSLDDVFIPHDSNGNAQVRTFLTITDTSALQGSQSFMYVYDLPRINVTSSVTNNSTEANPIDFGSNVTFNITRPNNTTTHTLTYTVNGVTTTIGTGIATSITYAFPTSLVNSFTGTANPTIYVTCTSSNSTTSGTMVYLHVPNSYQPACTLTLQETTTMPSGISVYVKGKSKIKGTIATNMSSDGGATVASYSTPINGTTYTTQTFTTELLTSTGIQSVTSTITDSRGRTATNTQSYTIYDYFTPTISNYSVKRCNSSGVEDESQGTYGLIQFTYNIAPVNNQNVKSVQVTCNGVTKTISLSNYSGTYTGTSNLFSGLSLSNSYNVTFKVIDSFNASGISYTYTITPAYTAMSMKSGGKGVTFGQIATSDDFHCYMKAYFHNGIDGLIDAIYPVGSIYMSVNATSPATLFGGTWSQLKNAYLFATNDTSGTKGNITGSGKDSGSTALTTNQLPAHKHETWNRDPNASTAPARTKMVDTGGTGESFAGWGASLGQQTAKIMETGETGSGAGHTHTIPNIEVYVWKRTA
jgi:hypothetical protein